MKNKLSRQQQNQRANLIFRYVKSLGPYSSEQDKSLYNKLNSGRLMEKQKSLLLSSRVYEISVQSSKSKKRVTFVQNEQNQFQNKTLLTNKKILSRSQKQKINPSIQKMPQNQNPEQICKDLLSLQRSVYNTFKIKDNQVGQAHFSTLQQKIPLSQSNFESKFLELQLQSKIGPNSYRDKTSQSHILKCQSQRLINTRNFNRNKKNVMRSLSKNNNQEFIQNQQNLKQTQQYGKISITNSEPSFSGISKKDKKQVKTMQTSLQLNTNRSSSYWKQQNDLMIQIFRKKLQSKFNLSPTKQAWK